jgi:hypothetical protein
LNQNRALWIVLVGSMAFALVLILALEAPGWAASPQSPENMAVPAPEVTPVVLAPLEMEISSDSAAETGLSPNCRFGVTAWPYQMQAFDIVSELGTGWYLDFQIRITPPGPAEAEYIQMVRIKQGREARGGGDICGPSYAYTVTPPLTGGELGAYVTANPGTLWVVGNEPDRINQDDICPQQYAEAYHEVYHFIKDRDPTAQVAIAGLVEVTPGRLQYLDIVWDTYLEKYGTTMPVDVWTMHIYVLSETGQGDANIALGTDIDLRIKFSFNCADPDTFCHAEHDVMNLFTEQVVMMREWMKEHGHQNKPLIITEYGILKPYNYDNPDTPEGETCDVEQCVPVDPPGCFCDEKKKTFHPNRVANFMEDTFDYLMTASDTDLGYPADEHRLVQQWLWFSLARDGLWDLGHASNLVFTDTTYNLTIPGQRWQDYVAAIASTVNLLPTHVPTVIEYTANGVDSVTVTLSAEVRNNGNIAPTGTVTVTFYSDEGLTVPIGEATFTGLGGCARPATVVTTTWASLPAGAHPFWVKVDSAETVTETKETDNVASGLVFINPRQLFLPLALRNG